jgi:hypothetical protein
MKNQRVNRARQVNDVRSCREHPHDLIKIKTKVCSPYEVGTELASTLASFIKPSAPEILFADCSSNVRLQKKSCSSEWKSFFARSNLRFQYELERQEDPQC